MKTKSARLSILSLLLIGLLSNSGFIPVDSEASTSVINIGSCQLFPDNNFWNVPIDNLPVHTSSTQWVNSIGAGKTFHMDFGSGTWDGGPIGIPYNIVSGVSVNKYPFDFYYPDESDPGPYPLPANPKIEWGSDRHILVVDTDDCKLYEIYDASKVNGQWSGGSGAIWDLDLNELRPDTWTSADAAGLPILPGLARYEEVSAGVIEHALRFTANCTANYYIWPARHKAQNGSCATPVPFGARFRLKAGFDVSGFSPQAQVLLQAFKTYGIVLADNGSNWYVSGSPNESWHNSQLHELDILKGSDFEAVDTSGLMVDHNSGATGFIISGNVGVGDVTLSYTDGTARTVTSQPNGSYSLNVSSGWSGVVTPVHNCYTFSPSSRTYSNVTTNQTGQNYSPIVNSSSLCASRSSMDFGEQLYYTKSDAITTTLTNFQGTNVHLGSFQRSSGQFILSSNTCAGATLTPSQSCTFDMQFKPTAYGALSGTLTINSDAANDPVVISLDAVGLPGTQLVTKGGSFEQDNDNNGIPDFWDTTGLTSLDGISNQYAKHGTYSVKLVGQSGVTKTLKQTIVQNGSAGDDFLYVLWSRAQSVPGGFKYRTQVSFYNGTTLVERRIKDYTSGTHDWEYRWLPITVLGDYTRIEVEIIYSLASGTVWFDSDSLKWAP
jgi:hypothetical protein